MSDQRQSRATGEKMRQKRPEKFLFREDEVTRIVSRHTKHGK